MTPEQRLDRAERIIIMMAKAGRRARHEWNEKVNILINAQIQTEGQIRSTDYQISSLATGHASLEKEMAELAESHRLTEQALKTFIERQERNGKSSQ